MEDALAPNFRGNVTLEGSLRSSRASDKEQDQNVEMSPEQRSTMKQAIKENIEIDAEEADMRSQKSLNKHAETESKSMTSLGSSGLMSMFNKQRNSKNQSGERESANSFKQDNKSISAAEQAKIDGLGSDDEEEVKQNFGRERGFSRNSKVPASVPEERQTEEEDAFRLSMTEEQRLECSNEVLFQNICSQFVQEGQWEDLAQICERHLSLEDTDHVRSQFFMGIALYKLSFWKDALKYFSSAISVLQSSNSREVNHLRFLGQIYYNMGLAYFKGFYDTSTAEQCFRLCVINDPKHKYGYKNLAFVKNLSNKYDEAIAVCNMAKEFNPNIHDTHSLWAFALLKRNRYVEAIRKIRKGAEKNPQNVDNWIVWAHLLRQVNTGKLHSALQKINKALSIAPNNEVALYEKSIISKIIQFDDKIPTDVRLQPKPELMINQSCLNATGMAQDDDGATSSGGMCNIF